MSVQKTISPVDGRELVTRTLATPAEIDSILAGAVRAQKRWRSTPLEERVAVCPRFVEQMEQAADAAGEELTWQMGRPLRYSPTEIRRGFSERARYMAD